MQRNLSRICANQRSDGLPYRRLFAGDLPSGPVPTEPRFEMQMLNLTLEDRPRWKRCPRIVEVHVVAHTGRHCTKALDIEHLHLNSPCSPCAGPRSSFPNGRISALSHAAVGSPRNLPGSVARHARIRLRGPRKSRVGTDRPVRTDSAHSAGSPAPSRRIPDALSLWMIAPCLSPRPPPPVLESTASSGA